MTTILVVDDMAVYREPIAAALRAKGYETMCADNGKEAMEIVRTRPPDLILLDLMMPVMDGLGYLRAVKADPTLPRPPVILLTEVRERVYALQAARLGVQDYVLKSQFSLDQLLHRIEQRLAGHGSQELPHQVGAAPQTGSPFPGESAQRGPSASADVRAAPQHAAAPRAASGASGPFDPLAALTSLKPLMTRSEVIARTEAGGELSAFSSTVANVLKLTRSKTCSIQEIARAVKQDHALALKILKLANSVVYTRGEPVETVEKAILRIGLSQIRQVMLNVSIIDGFGSVTIGDDIDAGQFWEHAIACGLVAAEIAHTCSAQDAESAFTMGLVHDVGRVIYAQRLGENYAKVLRTARELQLPLEQVESRLLVLNHAEGMDRLLHTWKFPKQLIDPIVFHQLPLAKIRRIAPRRVTQVATLALANRLCHALALGSSGNETLYPTEEFCQALDLDPVALERIEETVREQTENLKLALLAQCNDTAWADRRETYRAALASPLRPLFVSNKPHFDAFRIFCDQLAEPSDEPPNVGIAHITDASDRARIEQKYAEAESEAGVQSLPLIVLSPNGELRLGDSVTNDRHLEQLPTPVVIARFIQAINRALNVSHLRAAA